MSDNYGNNFYTPKELDHSYGHAFLSAEGDIFYSPNCSRRVDVPAPDGRYPFYLREARFEKFLSPRWWLRPYHYFSFVPLRPSFDGIVFETLRDVMPFIGPVEGGRFGLSSRKLKHWLELEDSLIVVAHLLNKGFFTRVRPGLTPIPPSLTGFKKTYGTFRAACVGIVASRDWFLMWMSLISSKISDIETFREDWFSYLNRKECTQDWLSAVQSSMVCDFSWHCPRVGTFLNVQNPEEEQPSVEWFYSWDIPVWYRPGPGSPSHVQPPPHILQLATTSLSRSPSPSRASSPSSAPPPPRAPSPLRAPSPSPTKYSGHEYEKAQKAYIATKPWEAFFAAREVKRQIKLAKETPSERQSRINRERKPPTVSADVFLWDWSADGAIELVRTRVGKKEREDVLGNRSNNQCKYDAVFNIWDVSDYFGPDDPDDDDDDDYGGGADIGNDDMDVDVGLDIDRDRNTVNAFISERIDQSSNRQFVLAIAPSSDQGPEVDLTHEANQIDIFRHMSYFYGFVPPLPIQATDSVPIVQKDWEDCLKSVGLRTDTRRPPPGLTGPIVDFVRRLQGGSPRDFEWDLLPGNRQPLNRETIVKCFLKLNEELFLVDGSFLADGNFTDWKIALTKSANALYTLRYILQSSEHPSSAALARHLAEEGIPFYTLSRLPPFPSSIRLDAVKTRIPRRGANYHFTLTDFHSYVAERKRLLATPRARAAILRGGIVGRLAKEHLEVDSVTFGPSSSVTAHGLGYSVEADGATYWDDGLSRDELAVICGFYCCFTGTFISWFFFLSNYI
jgi:hypothetical protein